MTLFAEQLDPIASFVEHSEDKSRRAMVIDLKGLSAGLQQVDPLLFIAGGLTGLLLFFLLVRRWGRARLQSMMAEDKEEPLIRHPFPKDMLLAPRKRRRRRHRHRRAHDHHHDH